MEFVLQSGQVVSLTMEDMMRISRVYQVQCTAEYIWENFEQFDQSLAEKIAVEARRLMDKLEHMDENTAISVAIKKLGLAEK